MNDAASCVTCLAHDRETITRPAAERRLEALVQDAIRTARQLPGAGFSREDSSLKNVFDEWADQLATQHSVIFELHDRAVWVVCAETVQKLSHAEIALLAAYSDDFSNYACTDTFMKAQSLEGFQPTQAVINQLYQELTTFGINYAEERS